MRKLEFDGIIGAIDEKPISWCCELVRKHTRRLKKETLKLRPTGSIAMWHSQKRGVTGSVIVTSSGGI